MPSRVDFRMRLSEQVCQLLSLVPWERQTTILSISFQKVGKLILPSGFLGLP